MATFFLNGYAFAAPTDGQLLEAVVEAKISKAGDVEAQVEITYRLQGSAEVDAIPLRALLFQGATLLNASAVVNGTEQELRLNAAENVRGVQVSSAVDIGGRLPAGPFTLIVRYDVAYPVEEKDAARERASFDAAIPLLLVRWVPEHASEGLFEARLRVPAAFSIVEAFPTVPRRMLQGANGKTYVIDLRVVPAFVRVRAQRGEGTSLTFANAVDASVVILLLVLSYIGWRAFSRQ